MNFDELLSEIYPELRHPLATYHPAPEIKGKKTGNFAGRNNRMLSLKLLFSDITTRNALLKSRQTRQKWRY
jgi:hypothetical protein